MKRSPALLLVVSALFLAACVRATTPIPEPVRPNQADPASAAAAADSDLSRVDEQGAVAVKVTPLNLDPSVGDLQFDISMNTHSVDLSMDLAILSTLTTDTGIRVKASQWEGPRGGHHVSGTLGFPAEQDGASVLAGATRVTLTILDVDAAARVFEWSLK